MSDVQPLPAIPGMIIINHSYVVDPIIARDAKDPEEITRLVREMFADQAVDAISEKLILESHGGDMTIYGGITFKTKYGFVPDIATFNKALKHIINDAYRSGFADAMSRKDGEEP